MLRSMWDLPRPGIEPVSPALAGGFFFSFFFLIYLFLAVLGLRFCTRAFSSCGKWGPLFIVVRGPLLLWSTGSRRARSVAVAHGPSCSVACEIFPDQDSNPCPLHWQADSQPLRHQGSPAGGFLTTVSPGKSDICFSLNVDINRGRILEN